MATKTVATIERPTTKQQIRDLHDSYNDMRWSKRKAAISDMLDSMMCEHRRITLDGDHYYHNGQRLVAMLTPCPDCQEESQAAVIAFNAVPSYVEQQAAAFAAEPPIVEPDVADYDERVLTLSHTPECLAQLQAAHDARQAYRALWPGYCPECHGTGEREVGSLTYEDPPDTVLCWNCVRQTICPRCGLAFAMKADGSEPCRVCGFEFEGGIPERGFCVCGADGALYEREAAFLPEFPE